MKKSLRLLSLLTVMVLLSVTLVGCEKKPEDVLKNMAREQAKVKSYSYTFDVTSKVNLPTAAGASAAEMNVRATAVGQMDATDASAPKQALDINIDAMTEGMTLSASGNIIMDNKLVYLKLNTVPNLGLFDLTSIKGVWYKIDLAKTMEASGQDASALNYTPEQLAQMQKLFADRDLFTVVNNYGIEKLDKVGNVYHYKVKFIQSELKKVITDVANITKAAEMTAVENKSLDDTLAVLDKADLDLWIGAKDYLVKKAALGMTVEADGNNVRLDGTMTFSDYNKAVKIEIPANATEFDAGSMMQLAAPAPVVMDDGVDVLTTEEIEALQKQMEEDVNSNN